MEWEISFANKKKKLVKFLGPAIPDRVTGVEVDGRKFVCRWIASAKTLELKEELPHAEATYTQIRQAQREKFSGEDETRVQLEYWSTARHRVESVHCRASMHTPGIEQKSGSQRVQSGLARAPLTGKVLKVLVKTGDSVEVGQPLVVIEAMKMENKIFAAVAGKVGPIKVTQGQSVTVGQEILRIEI